MGAIIPRKGDSVFANWGNFVEGSADIRFRFQVTPQFIVI